MWSISVGLECPLQLPSAGPDVGLSGGRVPWVLQGHSGSLWRWSRRMEVPARALLLLVTPSLGDNVKVSWSRDGKPGPGWSLC